MNNQTKLILDIRSSAKRLEEYSLLAYHINDSSYFKESFEAELVKILKLAYRYNNEVKELVR